MRCPFCNHEESKVTDSRNAPETNAVRRRRECLHCLRRFTTFETIDLTIQVQKRDGVLSQPHLEFPFCHLVIRMPPHVLMTLMEYCLLTCFHYTKINQDCQEDSEGNDENNDKNGNGAVQKGVFGEAVFQWYVLAVASNTGC